MVTIYTTCFINQNSCIYASRPILRNDRNLLPLQHPPIGICKGGVSLLYTNHEINFEILFKLILRYKGLMSRISN
jgi:hypothetical protein